MSKPSGTSESSRNKSQLAGNASLILGATGVVFGDIGTSPIYALKETLHRSGAAVDDIYGVVSLFFWTLTLVVSVKYLSFVMRADNKGEGGILALLSLMPRKIRGPKTAKHNAALILILVGTALLFGDGVLTPAISVLSATEGLALLNEDLAKVAVPLTVVILAALFLVQFRSGGRYQFQIVECHFNGALAQNALVYQGFPRQAAQRSGGDPGSHRRRGCPGL